VSARGRLLWYAGALALGGCAEHGRKPIKVDAGPAVVVVDPGPRRPAQVVPLVDEKEPDDDLPHAQPFEAGKGIRGTIGPAHLVKGKPASDEDLYSFVDSGGGADGGFNEVRVQLSGVAGVDLVLEALDGDGKRLVVANEGAAGEPEVIPNLATQPGHTYYLRVRAAGTPPAVESAPYELTVQSSRAPVGAEREPNDDEAHATQLPSLADVSGYYGRRRDEDWLRLPPVDPGKEATLRLELTAVDGVTPQLRVLLPGGKQVLANARGGRGDELRLRNVSVPGGVAPLVVLKAIEGRNLDLRWSLKLGVEAPLDGAEHEPNDTIESANPIGEPPLSGFLWPGDADFYCSPAGPSPDSLSTFELEPVEGIDLKLDEVAPGGKVVVHADDNGVGKGEALPPGPARRCVRVSARAKDSAFDAPYRLTLRWVAGTDLEREPNNSAAQATRWPDGAASLRGYLAPRGDEDYFRFVTPPGKSRATVKVEGGPPVTVRLTDEARAPLGPSLGAGSAGGPVVAGKSYLILVKGQNDKTSDPREPYTVSLSFE
jgi:hypothetical protein